MPPDCSIEWQLLNSRRGLAFLNYPSNSSANIVKAFETFGANQQRYFRTSFDYWCGGFKNDDRYHRWKASHRGGRYKNCFVFRNTSAMIRIYGFLIPAPSDARIQLCILAHQAYKKQKLTENSILDRMNSLALDEDVYQAISDSLKKR